MSDDWLSSYFDQISGPNAYSKIPKRKEEQTCMPFSSLAEYHFPAFATLELKVIPVVEPWKFSSLIDAAPPSLLNTIWL